MSRFPNIKELKAMGIDLDNAEGSLALPAKPTPLELFRFQIQQKFVIYKIEQNCSQKEMAEMIGIDEAKMSKILRHRLDEFSTDRLITLYQKINPDLKLSVG
ncbi:MAG: XRE family transcriptional regulator [Rhizobacter sp.]|nr:XRE family transcriptional regulator [Bacteriovorax sp.]